MPEPVCSLNTPASTRLGRLSPVLMKSGLPFNVQEPPTTADLPPDWRSSIAIDPETLLTRIAPTRTHLDLLLRAHRLTGVLYGPEPQRCWLMTPLTGSEGTPLDYLTAHGPDGWTTLVRDLMAEMYCGLSTTEEEREWATARLAGHRLTIRR